MAKAKKEFVATFIGAVYSEQESDEKWYYAIIFGRGVWVKNKNSATPFESQKKALANGQAGILQEDLKQRVQVEEV